MIETIHWHTLHPRFLGASSNVLDLGANLGQFSQAITERFGCRCVAVEPSPGLYSFIPETSLVSKIQAAVGEKSGVSEFHLASSVVAGSILQKANLHSHTIQTRVVSLADLLKQLGWSQVDLLKVDIEGAEIGMLAGCPDDVLGRIVQISVEFHDFCGMTAVAEVEKTIERLRKLGFFSVRMSRVGHQDTWLINRRLVDISTPELLYIRHVVRNWTGLKRLVTRHVKAGFGAN